MSVTFVDKLYHLIENLLVKHTSVQVKLLLG